MPRPGLRGGSVAAAVCGRSDGGGRRTRGRPPPPTPPSSPPAVCPPRRRGGNDERGRRTVCGRVGLPGRRQHVGWRRAGGRDAAGWAATRGTAAPCAHRRAADRLLPPPPPGGPPRHRRRRCRPRWHGQPHHHHRRRRRPCRCCGRRRQRRRHGGGDGAPQRPVPGALPPPLSSSSRFLAPFPPARVAPSLLPANRCVTAARLCGKRPRPPAVCDRAPLGGVCCTLRHRRRLDSVRDAWCIRPERGWRAAAGARCQPLRCGHPLPCSSFVLARRRYLPARKVCAWAWGCGRGVGTGRACEPLGVSGKMGRRAHRRPFLQRGTPVMGPARAARAGPGRGPRSACAATARGTRRGGRGGDRPGFARGGDRAAGRKSSRTAPPASGRADRRPPERAAVPHDGAPIP